MNKEAEECRIRRMMSENVAVLGKNRLLTPAISVTNVTCTPIRMDYEE